MSMSSGVILCEPTHLYNLITRCGRLPAVATEEHYLLLLDARERAQYQESHIELARHVKANEDGHVKLMFGVDTSIIINCVVYDSNTVSPVESTPAVQVANYLAHNGSRNTVSILTGGYERFSAEYPFLRTQKILYTQLELEHLPRYPSEVIPQLLYIGDHSHACNTSLLYNLKLDAVVNMATNTISPSHEGRVEELNIPLQDRPQENIKEHLMQICQFIGERHQHSHRVMVFGDKGISRAAAAVVAFLMYSKHTTLKEALDHLKRCRLQVSLQSSFIAQLNEWQEELMGTK